MLDSDHRENPLLIFGKPYFARQLGMSIFSLNEFISSGELKGLLSTASQYSRHGLLDTTFRMSTSGIIGLPRAAITTSSSESFT